MTQSREESIIEHARRLLGGGGNGPATEPGTFSPNSNANVNLYSLMTGKTVDPGDDCAVWHAGGFDLLSTTDMLVEGTHFLLNRAQPDSEEPNNHRLDDLYNVGWKALAVNVSDIAADAGEPLGYLVCLGIPEDTTQIELDSFTHGLADSAKRHRIAIWGGDLVKSNVWTIGITAIGLVPAGKAIKRTGAKAGDMIAVSGSIGLASTALKLNNSAPDNSVMSNRLETEYKRSFERLNKPAARVELALKLREFKIAKSMLDTSDSLAKSIRLIAHENKLGARIDLTGLVIDDELRHYLEQHCGKVVGSDKLTEFDNIQAFDFILDAAEDYELLFALSPDDLPVLKEIIDNREENPSISIIGELTESPELMFKHSGVWVPIVESGFEHFKRSDENE